MTFIATDGFATHKWGSVNTGTYAEDFAKIMPAAEAHTILARLRAGETVTFPGLWSLDEIKHWFGGSGIQAKTMWVPGGSDEEVMPAPA